MQLYRFSPIKNKEELIATVRYLHTACLTLCKNSFGKCLPIAGNVGIFCHYDDEYAAMTKLREEMTDSSAPAYNQKYFRLYEPIVVPAEGDVPESTYTHLYIRKPDPYRHHAGDVDFYLPDDEYAQLRDEMKAGKKLSGARLYPSPTVDMIELYNPDIDALSYVSTVKMTDLIRYTSSQS